MENNQGSCEIQITQRKDLILELIDTSMEKFFLIFEKIFLNTIQKNKYHEYLLRDFQDELETIPQWTVEDVREYMKPFVEIRSEVNCFLSNIHVLNKQLYPSEIQI